MPSQVQERLQAPPHMITRYLFGPWAIQALKSAIELEIFSALSEKPQTGETLATERNADPRGITILLEALAAMELLEKKGNTFQLTDVTRLYLLPSSELYMGPYIQIHDNLAEIWGQLTHSIKNGKSQACVNQQEGAEAFFPHLAAVIFPMSFTTAQSLAEKMQIESLPVGARVLDLAAGSAVWSIPMAQRNANLQVDALDFPATLATTRHFVEKYALSNQFHYLEGDWQAVDLPDNAYDIVLLGHILHSEGTEKSTRMFAKLLKALKPGGRLVIAEFLTNPERNAPLPALLFGLNMYLATEAGCVFSDAELTQMLEAQGYEQVEKVSLPFYEQGSPVMIAKKPL